jgi:nucleoside kinase
MVDPTGAGDAYRAGFLAALHKGYEPLTACRIGTVTASFVVEQTGCQTNLADWGRMEERYRQSFGSLDEPKSPIV